MSSDPMRGDGWYETVPLSRVAWYDDTAPIADPQPETLLIERRSEPPMRLAGRDTHTPTRLALRGNAAAIIALLWVLVLGFTAGAYAYVQSASPLGATAEIGLALTAGWITVDLAKAYRRQRRYHY